MEVVSINIDDFCKKIDIYEKNKNVKMQKSEFDKFMYNMLSIDFELDKDDIEALNLEYINRLSCLIDSIDFYNDNKRLLLNNDYVSLLDLYRFENLALSLSNIKNKTIQGSISPSMLFI